MTDIFSIIENAQLGLPTNFNVKISIIKGKVNVTLPHAFVGVRFDITDYNDKHLVLTINHDGKRTFTNQASSRSGDKAVASRLKVGGKLPYQNTSLVTTTGSCVGDEICISLPEFEQKNEYGGDRVKEFIAVSKRFYELLAELNLKPLLHNGVIVFSPQGDNK